MKKALTGYSIRSQRARGVGAPSTVPTRVTRVPTVYALNGTARVTCPSAGDAAEHDRVNARPKAPLLEPLKRRKTCLPVSASCLGAPLCSGCFHPQILFQKRLARK